MLIMCSLFSIIRQTQLDGQLLQSGRLMEAAKSLIEWLLKVKATLNEESPMKGDQETVSGLVEQHKVCYWGHAVQSWTAHTCLLLRL